MHGILTVGDRETTVGVSCCSRGTAAFIYLSTAADVRYRHTLGY